MIDMKPDKRTLRGKGWATSVYASGLGHSWEYTTGQQEKIGFRTFVPHRVPRPGVTLFLPWSP